MALELLQPPGWKLIETLKDALTSCWPTALWDVSNSPQLCLLRSHSILFLLVLSQYDFPDRQSVYPYFFTLLLVLIIVWFYSWSMSLISFPDSKKYVHSQRCWVCRCQLPSDVVQRFNECLISGAPTPEEDQKAPSFLRASSSQLSLTLQHSVVSPFLALVTLSMASLGT